MVKLISIILLGVLVGVSVFFSYGIETAGKRWGLLNRPTLTDNNFLPKEVNSAIVCLKRIGAKDYRPVGDMLNDWQIYQRLAEGAWPIKWNEKSNMIVGKINDIQCVKFDSLCTEGLVRVGNCIL